MKLLPVTIFFAVLVLSVGLNAQDQIEIPVSVGYNLISSNIHLPEEFWARQEGPDVRRIFAQLNGVNGNTLGLLVNEQGRFYLPSRNFNNISFWNEAEGYAADMLEDRVIVWEGERLPANTNLPMSQGWNYVAYFPTYQLDASAPDFRVLSPVIDRIDCAIDGDGGFMLPDYEFSNMAPWREGRGYMVRASENIEMQYPEEDEGAELWHPLAGDHWLRPPARNVMALLVNEIRGGEPADGDMIAAYNGVLLVGYGTVQDQRCGVPLWGDEPNSEGIDGLRAGEEFRLVYWIADQDEEIDAEIVEVVEGDAVFSHSGMAVVTISAEIGGRAQQQVIHFNRGWNFVSLNLSPAQEFWQREEGPDVRSLFRAQWYHQRGWWIHPYMMKDERGRWWAPAREWCLIPYWNLAEGYLVLVGEDNDVTITGESFPPDTDVPISTGWNMIAYFPDYQLVASAPDFYVISSVVDHVIIAKDIQGRFMLPQRRFSNMTAWQPGNGYQIKVDADVVLNYPSEQNRGAATEPPLGGTHWIFEPNGYQNMSLLISEITGVKLESGDQIAAFSTNGALVGVGDVSDGMCGLALWGRMNSSDPGMAEGESFELKLWRESSGVESPLTLSDNLVYRTDGFAITSAQVTAVLPSDVTLSGCFPNPFNGTTLIGFDLPTKGDVTLAAFNLSGQEVTRLHQGWIQAGHHETNWQASELPAGMYIIRLETAGKVQSMKVMLIK